MHLDADRLHLSPSDVTAFLACEHLTTLSLAHARGEVERPEVENEQAELIFRKGLEHEHAYLESLRAEGLTVLEIPDPEGDFDGAARRHRAGDPRRRAPTSSTRASSPTTAGAASPTSCMRQPDGTYEALDTKLARSAKPAYILQLLFYNEQLARIQGREPEHIHVLLGNGEQQSFRPQSSPPTTGASARGSSASSPTRRRPSRTPSTTAASATSSRSATRTGTPSTTSPASPASTGRRSSRLEAAGITTLAQLGRAPAEPVPAGINPDTWAKNREQAELQLHARETRPGHLPAPRAAAGSRLRAPARPLARRPLLRLRGQPVLGRGRLARVPLGDPRRRRQLHAAPRARPRDRAARVRDVRRPRPRAARAPPRPARLPLRPLRDHRAQAADGPLRHARARSSTTCSAATSSSTSTASSATASAPRGPATG